MCKYKILGTFFFMNVLLCTLNLTRFMSVFQALQLLAELYPVNHVLQ